MKKLTQFSVQELNELYLHKPVVYGQYFAKIINIAYYSNFGDIPYCEIQSLLAPEDTKIMPLSKAILVSNVA